MPLLSCTQNQLIAGLQAAATIEQSLTDDEWLRRYHYTSNWQPGVDLATYSNGGGDDMFVVASEDGVIIKGFDHESETSPYGRNDHSPWPGIFDGAPNALMKLLDDPAIQLAEITFLHWLPAGQTTWCRGTVSFPNGESDGSEWLLDLLPTTAQAYINGAKDYFRNVDESFVFRQFSGG